MNDVVMVVRTMPIRVAGNSGPLKDEVTWEEVQQMVGRPVKETTTVTNLTRRIGRWDEDLVRRAAMVNRPTHTVVTFLDYMFPEVHKTRGVVEDDGARSFANLVRLLTGSQVDLVGTGFDGKEGWYYARVL